VRYTVSGEETVKGVYELDVAAPPLAGISASVHAEVSRFRMDGVGGGIEASNAGTNTITGSFEQSIVGASRKVLVTGSASVPETLAVRVPEWATSAVLRVQVPDSIWRDMTGFAIATSDSGGTHLAAYAMHSGRGMQPLSLPPAVIGHELRFELYPAFARADAARNWQARVQITFMLPEPRALGSPHPVSLIAGERVDLPFAKPEAAFVAPAGFAPLIEARVRPSPTSDAGAETAVLHVSAGGTTP